MLLSLDWQQIGELSLVFITSMLKFMMAPFVVKELGYPFFIANIVVLCGGICGVLIFYYSSGFFLNLSHKRKIKKRRELRANGETLPPVKIKRLHKIIVKTHRLFGIIGLSLLTPSFLSVPLGAIITAKFYRKRKSTLLYLLLGVVVVGTLLNLVATLLPDFFGREKVG